MADREFQSWLEQTENAMNPFYDFIESTRNDYDKTVTLDDTFGWGARFRQMWSIKSDRPCGLLLTGPSGCGKHTAAAHMVHILFDDLYAIQLNGSDLCSSGYETAKARMLGLIGKYGKEEKPLCLILEGMEHCDCRQELLACLGQVLTASWLGNKRDPRLFVILIDSCEEDIPSVLRSRLRLCRMSLPNAQRRRAFLLSNAPLLQMTVNLDLLTDSTQGITYAQLLDLIRNLECVIYCLPEDQRSLRDEDLLEFLEEQRPAMKQENALLILAQSAQQLIEELPQLLNNAAAAAQYTPVVSQTQAAVSQPVLPDLTETAEEPSREDIASQPTKVTAAELYGEEFVQRFLIPNRLPS